MCIFTVSKKRSNFFLELRFATTRAACKITSRSKSNETPPNIIFPYILQAAFLCKCLENHFSTHSIGEKATHKMLFKLTPGGTGGTGGSGAGGSLQAEYNALYSLVEVARTTRLMSG